MTDPEAALEQAAAEHEALAFPDLEDSRQPCPDHDEFASIYLSKRTVPVFGPIAVPDDHVVCERPVGYYLHADPDTDD